MPVKPKAGDFLVLIVIIALAAFNAFLPQNAAGKAEAVITQNGGVIRRIALGSGLHESFVIEGDYTVTISVDEGKIRFSQANCPDKYCVNTGWISKPGQTAVCLPAKVMIKIEGVGGDDTDIVLG